jgi:hypothetical protein
VIFRGNGVGSSKGRHPDSPCKTVKDMLVGTCLISRKTVDSALFQAGDNAIDWTDVDDLRIFVSEIESEEKVIWITELRHHRTTSSRTSTYLAWKNAVFSFEMDQSWTWHFASNSAANPCSALPKRQTFAIDLCCLPRWCYLQILFRLDRPR